MSFREQPKPVVKSSSRPPKKKKETPALNSIALINAVMDIQSEELWVKINNTKSSLRNFFLRNKLSETTCQRGSELNQLTALVKEIVLSKINNVMQHDE